MCVLTLNVLDTFENHESILKSSWFGLKKITGESVNYDFIENIPLSFPYFNSPSNFLSHVKELRSLYLQPGLSWQAESQELLSSPSYKKVNYKIDFLIFAPKIFSL